MSDIQFDEDSLSTASRVQAGRDGSAGGAPQPAMVRWLMAQGLAKSPAMAQGILIGAVVILSVIALVIIT